MSKKIEAIILAGGKGTRLAPLTDNLPKPLVEVRGKQMIRYVLEHLKKAGISRIAISTAHLGYMIEEALGDGAGMGVEISYLREPEPMGTGGWTKLVDWDQLDDHFVVANADNLFWIDVAAFRQRHQDTDAVATIAAIEIPSDIATNYELLAPTEDRQRLHAYVDRSIAEPLRAANPSVFISSGWYIMTPSIRRHVPDVLPVSNESHVWPSLSGQGEIIGFYHAMEPWFDSGTHERLARVEKFLNDNPDYAA